MIRLIIGCTTQSQTHTFEKVNFEKNEKQNEKLPSKGPACKELKITRIFSTNMQISPLKSFKTGVPSKTI